MPVIDPEGHLIHGRVTQCLSTPPQQYGDDGSKAFGKSDYAGQYSPWSCDTIGSYIGTKDAKPKDVMAPGAMEMMVRLPPQHTHTSRAVAEIHPHSGKEPELCDLLAFFFRKL